MGYKVIGGGVFMDRLEDERQLATDLMKKVMDVPESNSFKSFDEGMRFVKNFEDEERLIFKPNDADVPKEFTYVAKDIPDLLDAMQSFKEQWKWKEDFQIQRFIKGTEVDFSGYFNGKEYLPNSMVIYFENKPLCNGDVGPATGGSIAVEFCKKPDEIFWPILEKLKPVMIKDNYQGQISINCIVSDEDHKPYFLEFCSRVGYPSFPMDVSLLEDNKKSILDLFKALANGESPDLFPTDMIASTVSIFVPPAPNAKNMEETQGEPIDWDIKYDKYFFPYYIMWDEKMCLAGVSSWVCQITSIDSTLDGSVSMIYDTYMPTLRLKDKIFRTDLGKSAKERIKKLHEIKII
jgi:phosphoribosylamine-glycine ligase